MNRVATTALLLALALASRPAAQHYQSDFPPEEFKARWNSLFDRIGGNAIAVVQGMPLTDGYIVPRQYNTFYYLSGIETPGAYLVLDGRTRRVTLYLPRRNEALERAEGKVLAAENADLVKWLCGVDDVKTIEEMTEPGWPIGAAASSAQSPIALYAEFSPAEGTSQSRGEWSRPRRRARSIRGTARPHAKDASSSCCGSANRARKFATSRRFSTTCEL